MNKNPFYCASAHSNLHQLCFPGRYNSFTMRCRAFGSYVLLLLAVSPGWAQQTAATLVGSVNDTSGAALAEATVRITYLSTNNTRETKTDQSGSYSMPFLPAGEYSVTAVQKGFQTARV